MVGVDVAERSAGEFYAGVGQRLAALLDQAVQCLRDVARLRFVAGLALGLDGDVGVVSERVKGRFFVPAHRNYLKNLG